MGAQVDRIDIDIDFDFDFDFDIDIEIEIDIDIDIDIDIENLTVLLPSLIGSSVACGRSAG